MCCCMNGLFYIFPGMAAAYTFYVCIAHDAGGLRAGYISQEFHVVYLLIPAASSSQSGYLVPVTGIAID